MGHYEYEISLYIDGELPKEKETELFAHITDCAECRNELSNFLRVKEKAKNHFAQKIELPEEKPGGKTGIYKFAFYAASAAAALLLFFLLNKKPVTVYMQKDIIKTDTVYVPAERKEIRVVKTKRLYPEANQQNYIKYVMDLPTYKLTEKDKANNNM